MMQVLVEDKRGNIILAKHPENYVCCIQCQGARVKNEMIYDSLIDRIRCAPHKMSQTLGQLQHNILAVYQIRECDMCNGAGFWDKNSKRFN